MNLKTNKQIINATILLMITQIVGCNSESSDQTIGGNSGKSDNAVQNVSGSFKNSYDTGVFYSTELMPSSQMYGRRAKECSQQYNNYYFETENSLVFGNPDLPEGDFKQVATWVENNFDSALTAMQVSKNEFFSSRYSIRLDGLKHIRNNLIYQQYNSISYPSEFTSWNYEEQVNWATKTSKNMKTAQAIELLVNDPYSPFKTEREAILVDKLYVCIHETNSTNGWGEGNLVGVNVGAPSIALPHEVDKIVKHEIIHTIQHALSANFESLGLPRWFSEGQAVLLSDMNVAQKSKHNEYDPTLVVYYNDEVGDQATAYSHYGLAYQYLTDANNQTNIIKMMKDIKQITYNFSTQLNSGMDEHHGYVGMFDSQMKQLNGSNLTVQQYRDEYHSLMTDY
ncbi:hypothetical protein [Litorilituus lipolyticus]|uniref:Peptidase MA-like domain-containing protein n=1 Tax=Litorilituus lipolyticus TaxID=2491017 RepID=A0A502KVF0_9GAMM|nr:hypothetical protein [Litorilituus lipolyticus]TPH15740.1 hypothetical protein EPA86_09215 [Litorilituus lipolyticus]